VSIAFNDLLNCEEALADFEIDPDFRCLSLGGVGGARGIDLPPIRDV
jgi:hypothetical protein